MSRTVPATLRLARGVIERFGASITTTIAQGTGYDPVAHAVEEYASATSPVSRHAVRPVYDSCLSSLWFRTTFGRSAETHLSVLRWEKWGDGRRLLFVVATIPPHGARDLLDQPAAAAGCVFNTSMRLFLSNLSAFGRVGCRQTTSQNNRGSTKDLNPT